MNILKRFRLLLWSAGLLGLLLLGTPLLSQDDEGPETPVAAESAEAAGANLTFIELLQQGGWTMIPLGLLAVASLGLMLYNSLAIRTKPFLRPDLIAEIEPAMRDLDVEKARSICDENPTPVTNIIGAGLRRIHDGELDPVAIEKAVEEASSEELASPFVFINFLNVIGSVAPMVGLFGTVLGMVKAFRAIGQVGMGDPSVLASNISEALVTTASGLVVAIPSLIAYFIFKNLYGKITSRISRITGDLFYDLFSAARKAHD
ncbi:MAG: MotA/TolQ/ExbB proton channel family protein [Opitutales bacterium]